MINFLKKNIFLLISIIALIVILLAVLAGISAYGKGVLITQIIENMLGKYPFAYFLIPKISALTGISIALPTIKTPVLVDIAKALLLTFFHLLISKCLYLLFLRLPKAAKNASHTEIIELFEDFMGTPLYIVADVLVKCISVLASVALTYFSSELLLKFVYLFKSDLLHLIVGFLLFVAAFILYSFLFSLLAGINFNVSCLKTVLLNLFPEILGTFITSSLWIAAYLCFINKSPLPTLLIVIIIAIVWSALADLIISPLKKTIISIHFDRKGKCQVFDINSMLCLIFVHCMVLCCILSPILSGTPTETLTNPVLLRLNAFPFMLCFLSGNPISMIFSQPLTYFIYEFLRLILLGFLCGLMQQYFRAGNLIVWYFVQCTIICCIMTAYTLITALFNINDKFIMFIIICIIAILCLFMSDLPRLLFRGFIMGIIMMLIYMLVYYLTGGLMISIPVIFISAGVALVSMIIMYIVNLISP